MMMDTLTTMMILLMGDILNYLFFDGSAHVTIDEPSQTLAPSFLSPSPIISHSSPPLPHVDTRSSSDPSFNPSAPISFIPSPPEHVNSLITPPATSQKKKETNWKASSQSTRTRVGKILRKFSFKAIIRPKHKMLSVLFS